MIDTPWDTDLDLSNSTSEVPWSSTRDAEWAKMSSEFTDIGYREGITAGKEAAVQEGFDAGFALVGAPLGRDLGFIRGQSSAILAFLISVPSTTLNILEHEKEALLSDAREIAAQLGNVRYSDIEPRDLEAEKHTREHLEAEGEEMEVLEEDKDRRKMEMVEDMLAQLSTGSGRSPSKRPTTEDILMLKARLEALSRRLGLEINRG